MMELERAGSDNDVLTNDAEKLKSDQGVDGILLKLLEDESELGGNSPLIEVGDDIRVPLPPKRRKRKSTKRRSNKPAFYPEIRILRRDIRRKYAFMLMNVMNSCDCLLLSQFLKEFAVPHFEAREEIAKNLEIKLIRMKVIHGQDQFVKFLAMNFTMMPDGIFRMSEVKVCQTLNTSGSRIVLRGLMVGTMLYEVRKSSTNDEKKEESPSYLPLQLLHKPYEYGLHVILTMQLDCKNRIISFLFNVENESVFVDKIHLFSFCLTNFF